MSSRDKRAKFVELANKRVNRALNDLRLVGNLANTGAYEYTEEDARKIVRAIQREVDQLKTKFNGTTSAGGADFSL